ncbi:MAG: hypothetical protein R3245_04065, partial [Kiloniellales bacterium]|nr:hypothetical protein [Kiloniellales bacterium]
DSEHYELLAPLRLNVVVFRGIAPSPQGDSPAFNEMLLKRINAGGKVRLTPGAFGGKLGLRAAFSNWMTEIEDVEIVTAALEEAWLSLQSR